MRAYVDLRPYITLRRTNSNEKGLFFSLPIINFYDLITETDDKISLLIEGYVNTGDNYPILFEATFVVSSFIFIHNGNFTQDVLLTTVTNMISTDDGKPIKLALYINFNRDTQMIDFYDAYYHKNAPLPRDFFDDSSTVSWKPFILGSIRGNKFPPNITEVPTPANEYFVLDIDPVTRVVTGCHMINDCMHTPRMGVILPNTKELAESITSADLLIGNTEITEDYKIIDISNDNHTYKKICCVKNKVHELREFQRKHISAAALESAFIKAADFKNYQETIRDNKKAIDELSKDIDLDLYQITRDRKDYHDNTVAIHSKTSNHKYYTALCLLIKDENPYIEEWLRSWDALGIDHFYIYDNGSKVPIKDTVAAIDNRKFLDKCTFIDFTTGFRHMQYDCYEHCLANFGNDCFWIGFVDTDEILEFTDPEVTNINSFLKDFEKDFGLWLPWECYNANNHVEKPKSGTQKDNYTKTIINPLGLYGKVFIQPYRTKKMYVHLGIGQDPFDIVVNQNHTPHIQTITTVRNQYYSNNRGCFTKAKINHYITRSFEDWVNKMNRGSCDPNFRRKFDVFFDYNPDLVYLKNNPKVQELLISQQGYVHG